MINNARVIFLADVCNINSFFHYYFPLILIYSHFLRLDSTRVCVMCILVCVPAEVDMKGEPARDVRFHPSLLIY